MAAPAANVLVLGGTTEATALCRLLADRGVPGRVSFAGRVARPVRQPLPQRVGGFGGADGLARYLLAERITHLVDATHPFASVMSGNAVVAAAQAGVPLIALTRAPWVANSGDRWTCVPDIAGAVAALNRPAARVMLAIGRMHLAAFAAQPQHSYLLRLVDPPEVLPPLPSHHVIIDRGPFAEDADRALMLEHRIELIVSKNAGGTGAQAKISAARGLGLPVIMIDRPATARRDEVHSPEAVIAWLYHDGTDLGV